MRIRRRAADRTAALLEAARLVAAAASRDLDATLDALAEQARSQLGADVGIIHLAVPDSGDFVRRRANPLAVPGSALTRVGERFSRGPFISEAFETRRPVFTRRLRSDPRFGPEARTTMPTVNAMLVAPLLLEGRAVGVLILNWMRARRLNVEDLSLAEALSHHAAAVIHAVELLEANRRARAELEALLDAVDDSITVYAADGRLVRANPVARRRFVERMGRVPASIAEFHASAGQTRPDGSPSEPLTYRALRGEVVTDVVDYPSPEGPRRFSVHAAPLRDQSGRVWAAVLVSREVTELHATIERSARLDGAIKTARRVAHELNNALTFLTGYGELLPRLVPEGQAGEMAAEMGLAASEAAEIVDRLQRIVRFEETGGAGPPMLDLEAAQPHTDGVLRPG